jgi:hypothetical protein
MPKQRSVDRKFILVDSRLQVLLVFVASALATALNWTVGLAGFLKSRTAVGKPSVLGKEPCTEGAASELTGMLFSATILGSRAASMGFCPKQLEWLLPVPIACKDDVLTAVACLSALHAPSCIMAVNSYTGSRLR